MRPNAALPTALAPLHSRAFRRYAAGQLPSITCSWAQVVALSAVVVTLDPGALGWVVALQFVPTLVLGPWCGALADRFDRRALLMAAEAGLGLVAAAYAVAAATDRLTLPVIGVLAAAWGIVNAVDTPARRALTPQLVPPPAAPAAAALSGTLLLVGMTLGAALGGLLVPAFGATVAFGINALSFFADVAVLATLPIGTSPRTPRAPGQVRDGLAHVWHTPALRRPVVVLATVATTTFTYQVSVPILVQDAGAIGSALAVFTAGALVGTLAAAARGRPSPWTTAVATAVVAAGQLLVGLAPALVLAGLAVAGLGWSLLLSTVVAQLQQARPDMLGRVMAVFAVVLLGATVVSGPLAGWLAAAAGATAPFLVGAAAAALTAAALTAAALTAAALTARRSGS